MSDVGAPQRLFAGAQGAAATGGSGRVVNPPSALLQLGGEAVAGTVAGRNAQGQLLIRADLGQGPQLLAVATAARLATGTAVTMTFRPHVSGLFVTVVPRHALDGGKAAPAASGRPAAGPAGPAAPGAQGPAPPPAAGGAQTPSAGGASGSGRSAPAVLDGGLPQPGVVAGQDARGRLLLRGGFGQATLDSPTPLPPGTRILLQASNVPPAEGAGAGGLTGKLYAEPRGPAEHLGTLRLLASGPLTLAAPAAAAPSGAAGQPASLARVWPTLTALAEAFAGPASADRPPAVQAAAGFPPTVGPRLALGLYAFVQAIEGAGLLAWLGEPARAALAAHPGLAAGRLGEADDELRWLARDPPGDWRLLLVPLVGQGPVEALRFFMKKRPPADPDGPAAPTHFLCDLALSRLGALQIEGLLREARFDLVLRSRRPLEGALQDELTGIFVAASEAGGLSGALRFQDGPDWQPLPVPHPAGRHEGLDV